MQDYPHGPQTDSTINTIRGKNLVGHVTQQDVWTLIAHIDALEDMLDESDGDDMWGTEGWRHKLGIDD